MKKTCCALLFVLLVLFALPALADEDISFSLESGFYEYPMPLEISTELSGATIYYTTDGAIPDETSTVYDGTITLMWSNEREDVLSHMPNIVPADPFVPQRDFPTGHIIRAVAITPKGRRSAVISGTFFIGYKRQELYGDTPIMLLATEPDNLFDPDTGIYVLGRAYEEWAATGAAEADSWKVPANYTQRGDAWERPVTVTFLPAEGEGFTQDMGMRIKGGASRGNAQKSLRLIARKDYGKKNVDYALYPDNIREKDGGIVDKYKSFTLRNGGNDADFGKIRDPFIANLATGMRFETAQNTPCIAFINGEYWGLYILNEEYTDNYIQYHYGIDNDNVITVKCGEVDDGQDEDIELFDEMLNYIAYTDMTDPANYAKACEMLDMGSFADYCALHFYIVNQDGPFQNNNWQMWRVREADDSHPYADGRWRMMLYDTDFSSGIYDDGKNFREQNIIPVLSGGYSGRHPALLLTSLIQNEDFQREFVNACCDVRNLYFGKNRVNDMYQAMSADYLPYRPDSMHRFGPAWTLWNAENHAKTRMQTIRTFFDGRSGVFTDVVAEALELNKAVNVTIKVEGSGTVYLNGRDLPLGKRSSVRAFTEYPLTVTAVPDEGAVFAGWKVNGSYAAVADPNAETTEVAFTRGFTLTVLFE